MKVPKSYIIKCPLCKKNTRAQTDINNSPQKYTCPKCDGEVLTPITTCCIICANDKKGRKCPRNLYMEARARGLEMR